MANVDCIYPAVSKRQMPSDEKIEFILCKTSDEHGDAL